MKTAGHHQRAAIILAGGDGVRLRALTRRIAGRELPKQFCPVLGKATLLEQTFNRVSLAIPAERTVTAVIRPHEQFYQPLFAEIPQHRVVVQPSNRGTAPAILCTLMHLAKLAPRASVAIFPCDHFVSDDAEFMRHVDMAFAAVSTRPDLTILLGMTPEAPDPGYGWIEPTKPIIVEGSLLYGVRRFWEKPDPDLAQTLWSRGCLWNSFVLVAQLPALMLLSMRALPELTAAFRRIRPALGTARERIALEALYEQIPVVNFSEQVLEKFTDNLGMLPVLRVDWSDLGEPTRVMNTLARIGVQPQWAA
jgi:mannose-1-phosphate guanylyltransferase